MQININSAIRAAHILVDPYQKVVDTISDKDTDYDIVPKIQALKAVLIYDSFLYSKMVRSIMNYS